MKSIFALPGPFLFFLLLLSSSPLLAQTDRGDASYYADRFHLKGKTASGELYDRYKFTAAHRTLPYGTVLKVTNLNNGRSVNVRVNDRGPFIEGRIVDLSYVAAEQIGMIQSGVVPVEIEVVRESQNQPEVVMVDEPPAPPVDYSDLPRVDILGRDEAEEAATSEPTKETATEAGMSEAQKYTPALFRMVAFKADQRGYGVQVGAYFNFYRLLEAMDQLAQQGYQNTLVQSSLREGKPVFRILVGPFERRSAADQVRRKLAKEKMEGIVVDLAMMR